MRTLNCDSAGARTQDPLRFGRGTYKKKQPLFEDAFNYLLSDSAGARTQDPLRFGRGTYKKKHPQKEDAFK